MHMKEFFEFIKKSTSPYHSITATVDMLIDAGYEKLSLNSDGWELEKGHKYYLNYHGSTLFAFSIGEDFKPEDGYRIAAAHGDFPGFRLKPNVGIEKYGYLQLNTEGYGGMNKHTWFDRPLSMAGQVVLKTEDVFNPRIEYVDFKKPIVIIPSLAVHLTPKEKEGVDLRKSADLMPICGTNKDGADKDIFIKSLAKHLNTEVDNILDYDLMLYNTEEATLAGINDEFILSPRLDNLSSIYAAVKGILDAKRKNGINLIAVFDHEEVGSGTKQGAASTLANYIIDRIYKSLGYGGFDYRDALENSLLMSVDVSQGFHPNYSGRYDSTNKHVLGEGIAIKKASSKSYATDSETGAIVQQICHSANIPYKKSVNHSDLRAGSTLGPLMSTVLPIRTVDIGIPLLAMHSCNELAGAADMESLIKFMRVYFDL